MSTEMEQRSSVGVPPSHHASSDGASDKNENSAVSLDEEKGAANVVDEKSPAPPTAAGHGPPIALTPSGQPAGPPPDGGLQAWLQVLGSWMLFFNTWGILNTFGVYQTYYESGALFKATSSNIAWIGSIQALMVLLIGAVSGPVYDRGHFRLLLIVGSFLVVFGHMMLSLCHEFWQALLAQGFVIGIGGGMLFVPAVAIMPTYFSSKLGMSIGIAASGSSCGGIIYPIMFYRLINEVGFGWGVRILGFTALATLLIPLAVMKMRVAPPRARALIDKTAFTDTPYITFVVGTFIGFIGLYVGVFYTSFFGAATRITDPSLSFYLVPILNAGSVFGRTLPNILADKIGPLNVMIPGAVMVGIILLCNLAVHTTGGLVVTTLFFGFFSGVFIALPTVCFVQLTKDKSKLGTRIGQGFAMIAFGVLAGGPGGGGILQRHANSLDWTGTWIYGGVMPLAAAVIFMVVRYMVVGTKVLVKV